MVGKRGSVITSGEKGNEYDGIISVKAVPIKDSLISHSCNTINNRNDDRKSRVRSITMLGERNGDKMDNLTNQAASFVSNNIQHHEEHSYTQEVRYENINS